jgi:NAD(P)-dependent dehydrogenase (short-subunit alcohol dehydrogenase family)
MESLLDATVVITGASSGIGLATAQASARRSANVLRTTPHKPSGVLVPRNSCR